MTQSVVLVIPTLNEAENIVSLIKGFQQAWPELMILVADSDSPDGTAEIVRNVFPNQVGVIVIPCKRSQGRGAAMREAYEYIKKNLTVTTIVTADADFSHDPKDLPDFITALKEYDVVIGSRYLATSKIIDWPYARYFFSKVANSIIKITLSIPVQDCTNGYRAFSRACLDSLDAKDIDANGFIALSQELLKWHRKRYRIKEIPITFKNRTRGESHFSLTLVIEAMVVVSRLFRESWRQ